MHIHPYTHTYAHTYMHTDRYTHTYTHAYVSSFKIPKPVRFGDLCANIHLYINIVR